MLLMADGADGKFPLDPIRLMKGCFLVSQIGRAEWQALFAFEPYDYGPFDASVYRARDALLAKGLIDEEELGRYSEYSITEHGREQVAKLVSSGETPQEDADWFRSIGRWVTSKSFNELLREIYEQFPGYATRSIARL